MAKQLFTPYKIGNCMIPNRLVVPAMVVNYCNEDGTATERYISYHETKAKGGWGLIITEDYAISKNAMGYQYIAGLWNDDQIESHTKLTERIHQYDSKIFCQIYHAGRQSHAAVNGGVQPVAPSAIPCPWSRDLPRELTIDEIQQIVKDFGAAALRAKKSGFDGVEIHGGHGYLIAEFMSPYSNKRTDEYGGNMVNRLKLAKDVIAEVRKQVGDDFPLSFRISADEKVAGGRDMSETQIIVQYLESWGINVLNISTGVYNSHNQAIVPTMHTPHAWTAHLAAEIKSLVNIPVITTGRINDPLMADHIVATGKADFVGMARGSLADPNLPNKAMADDHNAIRYCIGCLQGCVSELVKGNPVRCLVNPELGLEYKLNDTKDLVSKKVFVVGGGPGGMNAAIAAASKGHEVHLYEKESYLGGQFRSAAYPPTKGELANYTAWLIREVNNDNIHLHLNSELSSKQILSENPDAVIIATGGKAFVPPIHGVNRPNVLLAQDVLLGKIPTGDRIFVAGGGMVGAETAAHLAFQEKEVYVADMRDRIACDIDSISRDCLIELLDEYRVNQMPGTKLVEITEQGVLVEQNGRVDLIPVDTVVIALGSRMNDTLYNEIKESYTGELSVIGDAIKPRQALDAVLEGYEAGLNITPTLEYI